MNHYRLCNNFDTKPLLDELKLNDDWVDVASVPDANHVYGTSSSAEPTLFIRLIGSFRKSDDPESATIVPTPYFKSLPVKSSTWTGIAPSKIFHKYKQVQLFLDRFKATYNANIAKVNYIKVCIFMILIVKQLINLKELF